MPSPQPNVGPGTWHSLGPAFWSALIGAAFCTGLAAGLLMDLLRAVQRLSWGPGTNDFLDAVQRSAPLHRLEIVAAAGALVVATRLALRLRGSGHGGELNAAIWFYAGRLPFIATLLNAIASIVIVAMGASMGREGAPKQMGGLAAGIAARWAGLPPAQRRLLVACCAGAGMGAVYNVPLGGALFSLEVLLGSLSLPLVAPALAASTVATATAWLLLPDKPAYAVATFAATPALIVFAALAGPPIGLAAAFYVRLICWADSKKPKGWAMAAAPLAAFGALGATSIAFPQLLGNGMDAVQLSFTGNVPLRLAIVLAALKPLATAACLGSGAPGGLMTPTITVGALIGIAGGQAWSYLWPAAASEPGAFAIVCAGAMLAAATQGPVSAMILLLEMTRHIDGTMVPLVLATAGAMLMARRLEPRSLYSGRTHAARAMVAHTGGLVLPAAMRLPEALSHIAIAGVHSAALVDQDGKRLGQITVDDAAAALETCVPVDIATARDAMVAALARQSPVQAAMRASTSSGVMRTSAS
jgi:H+/Cl- antiporter ClcA